MQDSLARPISHWNKRKPDADLRRRLFTILYNRFITEEPALACRDLLRGFAVLARNQQVVLRLIGAENFSYEETARALGVPIGTGHRLNFFGSILTAFLASLTFANLEAVVATASSSF